MRRLLAALLLSSCGRHTPTPANPCRADQVLAQDTCQQVCIVDDDCGDATQACFSGLCVPAIEVPTIQRSEPLSPAKTTTVQLIGDAAGDTGVSIYTDSDCTTRVAIGAAGDFAATGFTVAVSANATSTFYAQANVASGQRSLCSTGFSFVEDETAPDAPTLVIDPEVIANDNKPLLTGTAADATATLEVFFDDDCSGTVQATTAAATFASQGVVLTVPDNATLDIAAHLVDAAGNVSPCSNVVVYREDSEPPLFAGLASVGYSSSTARLLSWTAATDNMSDPSTIAYEICYGAVGSCVPFIIQSVAPVASTSFVVDGLTFGDTYDFAVRARDEAGNVDDAVPVITATVACAPGYGNGPDCVWTTGPLNSSIAGTTDWTLGPDITYSPTSICGAGGGSLALSSTTACANETISQSFTMDTPDLPPMVLQVTATAVKGSGSDVPLIQTILGNQYFFTVPYSGCVTSRDCLGEDMLDTALTLTTSAWCVGTTSYEIDDIGIVPANADECPAIGTVLNGDFDDGTSGWTISAGGPATAPVVDVDPTAGKDGGPGLSFQLALAGDNANAMGQLSVPLASTHLALSMWASITAGYDLQVQLGNESPRLAPGDGTGREYTFCIPTGLAGTVQQLVIGMDTAPGTATSPVPRTAVIDALDLVSDSRCDPYLTDGDLEIQGLDPTFVNWTASVSLGTSATSALVELASYAYSGNAGALLNPTCTSEVSFSSEGTIPASAAGAGPALKFHYRMLQSVTTLRTMDGGWSCGDTTCGDGTWREAIECLAPGSAGLTATIGVKSFLSGSCTSVETTLVDAFELTTDASCPP